jgi:hypothetical protein
LARKLSAQLDLPLYEVDPIQWAPNWEPVPAEEIQARYDQWLSESRWIIDGWGTWDQLITRFETADTIVHIDMPISRHYWWAAKRQILSTLNLYPHWPPAGCKAWPVTKRLFTRMAAIHKSMRPVLLEHLQPYHDAGKLIELKSPKDIREFVRRIGEDS